MTEKEMEQAKRAKLKREKPSVYEKVLKIADRHAAGIPTPIVDIAYSTVCNLKCLHCSARRLTPKKYKLTPEVLKNFTDQAEHPSKLRKSVQRISLTASYQALLNFSATII